MMPVVTRKLLYLTFVLWSISLGTFALFSLAPGDAAQIILNNQNETPARNQILALREELGLDAPWNVQYFSWLKKILKGDFGQSWQTGRPVVDEIFARFPATLELAGTAFAMVLVLSVLSGTLSAVFRNRFVDRLIQAATVVLTAMPTFWVGLLLIYLLSLQCRLFPIAGRGTLAHLVLPSATLALGLAFFQGNVLRAILLRIMSMDHIRFAFAKGLGKKKILVRHILPAALPPMVTMWGICMGQLLGGAVIVESVFAWPGIGRLTVEAVMGRDLPTAQALVLLISFLFVMVNTLADFAQLRLDPQMGTPQ
ncbi:MAG: ABC transporter permease [Proteobacteria bacterium]|nr:ABC transporter permease [Pseudomonadota bacterium]